MLSNQIDLRIYLSDAEFRGRVLQSKAWAEYLRLPPIPPYDETAGLAEIEQRNAVRAETNLPLLDARQELARLRQAYESERFSERFYDVVPLHHRNLRPDHTERFSKFVGHARVCSSQAESDSCPYPKTRWIRQTARGVKGL